MTNTSNKKSIIIILSVFLFIIASTYFISIYAKGYQINFKQGTSLTATGILSVTSKPKAASVYINDRLITATDDTINLTPDTYIIKIAKDGYLPWQKTIQIKKEIVYQTDTQLYRSAPDLKPITLTGAINPTASPDLTKIIYSVASASASRDNGLYLIELTDNSILINRNTPQQISPDLPNVNWSKFNFIFSPNSRQILATNKNTNISYLLSLDTPVTQKTLLDVTPRLSLIKEDWNNQNQQLIASKLELLPKDLKNLVSTDSAKDISFSSADDKILYLAKKDSSIPKNITTPPPAQSTQTQSREIKKGNYYVYDIKDDTNFLIGPSDKIYNSFWLPNSTNVIFMNDQKIKVIEYDGTNEQTLFAGSFNKDSVYPWSDGNKIITLTSPYIGSIENLYAIVIR